MEFVLSLTKSHLKCFCHYHLIARQPVAYVTVSKGHLVLKVYLQKAEIAFNNFCCLTSMTSESECLSSKNSV